MVGKLGDWVDAEFGELGTDRRVLRFNFKFRKRRWYIETFNPLWWFIVVNITVGSAAGLYWLLVLIIGTAPTH